MGGLGVTYLWLWMLTINPAQQPEIDELAVDLILEMPRSNIEKATEQPVSLPRPTPVEETVVPAILPPKLRTPVPVAAQKIAPPLPDLQPAAASALIASPPENAPPQPTVAAPAGLDDPVPVSRLTRTPAFVHKALPNDPEDVQIPPGGVRVIARITLDATAVVRNIAIDKSGEPAFDGAVIAAIHRSRFTPGYIGDLPVATVFNQTYRFQLQ